MASPEHLAYRICGLASVDDDGNYQLCGKSELAHEDTGHKFISGWWVPESLMRSDFSGEDMMQLEEEKDDD